jgi:hypothetical protein
MAQLYGTGSSMSIRHHGNLWETDTFCQLPPVGAVLRTLWIRYIKSMSMGPPLMKGGNSLYHQLVESLARFAKDAHHQVIFSPVHRCGAR